MAYDDLGRSRDLITRIEKTSTSGLVDTYTIYTESHPEGMTTFDVVNGRDGANGSNLLTYSTSFSTLSDLQNWLQNVLYPLGIFGKIVAAEYVIPATQETRPCFISYETQGVYNVLAFRMYVMDDGVCFNLEDDFVAGTLYLSYVQEASGVLPTPPTTDGTYVLKCIVSGGTPTYSWEAEQ